MTIEQLIVSRLSDQITDGDGNVPLYHRVIPQSVQTHRAIVYDVVGSQPIMAKNVVMGTVYNVEIRIAHRESDKLQLVASNIRSALEGYQDLGGSNRWNFTLYNGEEGQIDARMPEYHIIVQDYQFTKAD
jgi:hypothetical protein